MVRALLAEGTGEVRAVTRRPSSRAAAQLRRLGARVVAADLDDGRTLEPALEGAYGAFVVTDFWEHCSQEREVEQVAACCPGPLTWWGYSRVAAGCGSSQSPSCSLASPTGSGTQSPGFENGSGPCPCKARTPSLHPRCHTVRCPETRGGGGWADGPTEPSQEGARAVAAGALLYLQLWGQNMWQHQKSRGFPQWEEFTLGEAGGFRR